MKRTLIWILFLFLLCSIGTLSACSGAVPETDTSSQISAQDSQQQVQTPSSSEAISEQEGGTTDPIDTPADSNSVAEEPDEQGSLQNQPAGDIVSESPDQTSQSESSDSQSAADQEESEPEVEEPIKPDLPPDGIRVRLQVECVTAFEKGNETAKKISDHGIILAEKEFQLSKDATVYDLLLASGLDVQSQKGMFGQYVTSIASLAEKMCGAGSGWVYYVNGDYVGMSSSLKTLQDGDSVRWMYTCNGGADLIS